MVKVTWGEAQAFCEWGGGRLPTEAEWALAARGGAGGLKYPWGNDRTHDEANYWKTGGCDQWKHTAPVGSFPGNGYGLYDMAGNVYEWVADWFDPEYYSTSTTIDPSGPGFINPCVLRTSARLRDDSGSRRIDVGFRCVRDDPP